MKGKEKIIVTFITLLLFFSMSIGYAIYGARVNTTGVATFTGNGNVIISSAILTDYKNLTNPANPLVNETRISFDLNFYVPQTEAGLNDDYYATYQITISNDSVFDYSFQTADFTPSLTTINENVNVTYSIDGIDMGEIIPSKDSKTFNLTIIMIPNDTGNINVSGDIEIGVDPEQETGSLLGSIPANTTGNLVNNSRVQVTATIINSYNEAKDYNIVITNNNFQLVDSNDNPLTTFNIAANGEVQNTFYIKLNNGATFPTDRQNINVFLQPVGGSNKNMGVVSLTVPKDSTIVDVTPPTISNVVGTQQNTKGEILVTFNGSDDIGIAGYTLEVYRNNTLIDTISIGPDVSSYTLNNMQDGNYYFKMTIEDTSGLTATAQSTSKEFDWTMNVVINITQGGPNGNYTVDYGQTFTTTITANGNRTLPTTLTITMGGTTLNNNQYTYSNNNGRLSIPNVTGDLNITGQTGGGGCLIEGTKVLLANGKYKNIEDIKYDDLLLVWNYETGKTTKEYPIWIEKKKTTNSYTKITFSDNSTIGVVGRHAFFDNEVKEFINYEDSSKFKIGTKILKLDNNKLKEVKVVKIEKIKKRVNYYFIASTRYWNIIADDYITTDGYTDITNLYPFDNKISWNNDRKIKRVKYEYVKDVLPYYLFKGFRAEEVGTLLSKDLATLNSFKEYVERLIVSKNMILEPIMKNNERYWMVSNSIDTKGKLVKEGDYYILPKGRWYSTSENKYYNTGDKVQVWTGMYFEKE